MMRDDDYFQDIDPKYMVNVLCTKCRANNNVPKSRLDTEVRCIVCSMDFIAGGRFIGRNKPNILIPPPPSVKKTEEPSHESKLSLILGFMAFFFLIFGFIYGLGRDDFGRYLDSQYSYPVYKHVTKVRQTYGYEAGRVAGIILHDDDTAYAKELIEDAKDGSGLKKAHANRFSVAKLTPREEIEIFKKYESLQEDRANLERRQKFSARLWDFLAYLGIAVICIFLAYTSHKKKAW